MPIETQAIPDGKRVRAGASTQLLHEWLQIHHAADPTFYELRLGATMKTAPGIVVSATVEAALRNSNRYADAVVIDPGGILIIESKMEASAGALGQLEEYYLLAPFTPKLTPYLGMPIRKVLLVAVNDDHVARMAMHQAVQIVVFTPQWAADYLDAKYSQSRSASKG